MLRYRVVHGYGKADHRDCYAISQQFTPIGIREYNACLQHASYCREASWQAADNEIQEVAFLLILYRVYTYRYSLMPYAIANDNSR